MHAPFSNFAAAFGKVSHKCMLLFCNRMAGLRGKFLALVHFFHWCGRPLIGDWHYANDRPRLKGRHLAVGKK